MPTYDYVCHACGHEWDMYQAMSDNPIKKCPACGKLKAERLIGTGAGVIFKGSGFYETEYRSESYKQGADAARKASEPAKSDGKGESKSDSKSSSESSASKSSGSDD